jgi:hypothetical protein
MSDCDDAADRDGDPFRPPEIPTEVCCLHCGETYESYLIEWRVEAKAEGGEQGFWCCPTPGCGGIGFGFDILPTDPEYQDDHGGGWSYTHDGDEDPDEGTFGEGADPEPPGRDEGNPYPDDQ